MDTITPPKLKAKDAPDLGRFDWSDPFRLEDQLTEEERMLRDGARAYATDKLQPRVTQAYAQETTDPGIFAEMGGDDNSRGIRRAWRVLCRLWPDCPRSGAGR